MAASPRTITHEVRSTANVPAVAHNLDIKGVRIAVDGPARINRYIIQDECRHHGVHRANTLGELEERLTATQESLKDLGIYQDITSFIDKGVGPGQADVIFKVVPKRIEYGLGASMNGKGQAAMEGKLTLPSIFKGHSKLEASTKSPSYRWFDGHETRIELSTPRLGGVRNLYGALELAVSAIDMRDTSSYEERVKNLNFNIMSGNHALTIQGYGLRDLVPTLKDTAGIVDSSYAIQTARQRSSKSGVKYTYAGFFQDVFGKFSGEVAGLLGDVKFLRADATLAKTWLSVRHGVELHAMLAGGCLHPLDDKETCVQDRFFIGGANGLLNTTFKGFSHAGMGPADSREIDEVNAQKNIRKYDHVGGNVYTNAYVTVGKYFSVQDRPWKLFFFGQYGGLGMRVQDLYSKAAKKWRGSIGFGIATPFISGSNFEVVVSKPLCTANSDFVENFQWGLRFEG